MKMLQLTVILLAILLHAAVGFPSDRRGQQGKQASWEDINVVAHGLLQLGQGLKEHVDKSKAQMRDINAKLKAFNGTLAELERRQREQEEGMPGRSGEAEERAERLTEEVRVKVEDMKKQGENISSRMDRLEEKMQEVLNEPKIESNNSEHSGESFIQRLLATQSRRIDQLVEKIQQQQDKLEKQSLHLQALQSKVAHKRVKSHRRRDEETVLRVEAEPSTYASDLAKDCHDLFAQGQRASGVYTIQPESSKPFNVLCEMTSEGGWTVIQKRFDGSQNFNLPWENYKSGFGSLNGEFWLGLEKIHSLSNQGEYVLQVEVSDGAEQHESRYGFQLDGEEKMFSLHLQPESEDQENIMTTETSAVPFSTPDRDNDLDKDFSCAELLSGGWWFSSCGKSNLNGKYPRRPNVFRRHHSRRQGMFWTSSEGPNTAVRTTLLKIAPATIKH